MRCSHGASPRGAGRPRDPGRRRARRSGAADAEGRARAEVGRRDPARQPRRRRRARLRAARGDVVNVGKRRGRPSVDASRDQRADDRARARRQDRRAPQGRRCLRVRPRGRGDRRGRGGRHRRRDRARHHGGAGVRCRCAPAADLSRQVRQVSLVTGAASDGEPDLDWEALARPGQAFAIYMGVRRRRASRTSLLAAGADPATPVVIVENGGAAGAGARSHRRSPISPTPSTRTRVRGPAILFVGLDWADAGLRMPPGVETFRTTQAAANALRAASPADRAHADGVCDHAARQTGTFPLRPP